LIRLFGERNKELKVFRQQFDGLLINHVEMSKRFGSIHRITDNIAFVAEKGGHEALNVWIIIDNQNNFRILPLFNRRLLLLTNRVSGLCIGSKMDG
jgi:hypothetical protein